MRTATINATARLITRLANVTRQAARLWRAIASKKLSRSAGVHATHPAAESVAGFAARFVTVVTP
jgi:hypothetical protein